MDAKSGAGRSILTTVLTFALATIAMAAGASMNKPTPTPPAASEAAEHAEPHAHVADPSHGGQVERVHDVGCDLIDVSTLSGNWTHGDYVSAVAKSGSHQDVRSAAQSDCGKPLAAMRHGIAGGVPPGQAKQDGDRGEAHAGGPPANAGPPADAGPPANVGPPATARNSGETPGGS